MTTIVGNLRKMRSEQAAPIQYFLPISDQELPLNALIGKSLKLTYEGEINCIACDRKTKKSFSQGYCYPCFKSLARCDMCIMKPETCHYDQGTCREPEWAENYCMQEHYVYLSNASGLKVGITRQDQIPIRWVDQGAIQAIPLFKVKNRYQSGLVETKIAETMKDKTNWRTMLKGEAEPQDLLAHKKQVLENLLPDIEEISKDFGEGSLKILDEEPIEIAYPVEEYPTKVSSFNLDKNPLIDDVLVGIKGQYLIFSGGVINIRKYGGYKVSISV